MTLTRTFPFAEIQARRDLLANITPLLNGTDAARDPYTEAQMEGVMCEKRGNDSRPKENHSVLTHFPKASS